MEGTENDGLLFRGRSNINSKSLENTILGAYIKIESEITNLKNQIKTDTAKVESLTSKMHQLQQQTEIYSFESQSVMEKIKDSNWSFTKEASLSLLKLKKPSPEILDMSEKFMILLDQKEKGWKMFQASLRNYESLKALMDKFNPDEIKEENVDLIMMLWKNYNVIHPKIIKVSRGASILLDWMTSCMEYKLKKATLENVKKTHSDVQVKIKDYNNHIAEKKSLVATLEEKLKELKENPYREEVEKRSFGQNSTQLRSSHHGSGAESGSTTRAATKLNKMLVPQGMINLQNNSIAKKSSIQSDENEQSSGQNASCEVKLENVQVNIIFSNTYRFPTNFGADFTRRSEDLQRGSRKNSGVEKIFKIIANHDGRNKEQVVLSDSKILFAKEKPLSSAGGPRNEANFNESHFLDIKPQLCDEDRTNSTYLNSLRNPLSENSNTKRKLFSTVGTNSGASIGIHSSIRHDETPKRNYQIRNNMGIRIEDDIKIDHNNTNIISARSKKEEETDRNMGETVQNDESFAACCKKGINRLFCS